ncbi:MAG TPA: DUF4123 domain-containing protein [Pyrinomonadaceae bacterium]|jgi:hypothetical protein
MSLAQQLRRHLFADAHARVFAVLDGAAIPDLLPRLHDERPDYECLYRGELAPDLAEVAPYLVQLEPDAAFTGWLLQNGWGHNWGVFATADNGADLRALRRHFRTFLIVHDEEGRPLYFRFYDPRVLRVYLPTCGAEELTKIFGSVTAYLLEDCESNNVLNFRLESNSLRQEKASLNHL